MEMTIDKWLESFESEMKEAKAVSNYIGKEKLGNIRELVHTLVNEYKEKTPE